MKTAELSGAQLDYWVAMADGVKDADIVDHIAIMDDAPPSWCRLPNGQQFHPSTNWSQGGPIIEREKIDITARDYKFAKWGARQPFERKNRKFATGPTPLIAAMRAHVASKFGDEVPDEAPA